MIRKLVAALVFALSAITLFAAPETIDVGSRGELYFNAPRKLEIAEAAGMENSDKFVPAEGTLLWVGEAAPVTWLRFVPPADESDERILVVKPSFAIILDYVDLYVPRPDGGFDLFTAGAMREGQANDIPSKNFVFELPSDAFGGSPCYLRLSSSTDVSFQVFLETEAGFARKQVQWGIYMGVLSGIILAMSLYSLFLFASLKDISYLFYFLYIMSAGIWQFFLQGGAKALLGTKPYFDQEILWIAVSSVSLWSSLFVEHFLRFQRGHSALKAIFRSAAALGGVSLATAIFGWWEFTFIISHALGVALPLLIIAAAIFRLKQGYSPARYFLAAWSVLAVGSLAFALMGLKVLPVNFLTINGVAIGIAAESILLSMALADRFRRLQDETKRLDRVQAHYRELSLTDPLTGLRNKRYLEIELEFALQKAQQSGSQLSLILMDADDFKQKNDSLGHATGDEFLVILARCLHECVRDGDSVCRIGGDEFVVILPNVHKHGAREVAERIRSKVEEQAWVGAGSGLVRLTVSLGVAASDGREEPDALIARADEAMYEAKRLGKNRVVLG